jgi:hypothetical protein
MRRHCVIMLLVVVAALLVAVAHLPATASVIYVDTDAAGSNEGTSWVDAYVDLQSALGIAEPGDEIWVAAGTYYPTSDGNRDSTFTLVDSVALYGGFAGGESSVSERDWLTNVTVLSGDIGVVDDDSDNSYHVVVGSWTSPAAVLDGFTVTRGNANHETVGDWRTKGGGMYNVGADLTIANVVISESYAELNGGGLCNDGSSPTLTEVVVADNSSGQYGGGIYNRMGSNPSLTNVTISGNVSTRGGGLYNSNSHPTLFNVVFLGNSVTKNGGAVHNYMASAPTFTNCTFSQNTANNGAAIFNLMAGGTTLVNCILWGDSAVTFGNEIYNWLDSSTIVSYSIVMGGLPDGCVNGGNNVSGNPLFVDGGAWDVHLSNPGSPAFDAGNNAAPGLPATDRDGSDRIKNGTVDLGAYELQAEGAILAAVPASLIIGLVVCDETVCDSIHLVNVGPETCTVFDISGCSSSPFSIDTSATAYVLPPGESTTMGVCVTPTEVGPDTCSVTIVSDAWDSPAVVPVQVEGVTGVVTPTQFGIVSVTPNPFNPKTTLRFMLPAELPVTAEVYSVAGARVRVLADGELFDAGDNRLVWDGMTDAGTPASSGVYFIRVETPVGAKVARAVLLK